MAGDGPSPDQVSTRVQGDALGIQTPDQVADLAAVCPVGLPGRTSGRESRTPPRPILAARCTSEIGIYPERCSTAHSADSWSLRDPTVRPLHPVEIRTAIEFPFQLVLLPSEEPRRMGIHEAKAGTGRDRGATPIIMWIRLCARSCRAKPPKIEVLHAGHSFRIGQVRATRLRSLPIVHHRPGIRSDDQPRRRNRNTRPR